MQFAFYYQPVFLKLHPNNTRCFLQPNVSQRPKKIPLLYGKGIPVFFIRPKVFVKMFFFD